MNHDLEIAYDGTEQDARARRVERLARVEAPWGISIEIVQGLADASAPYASPLVPSGFLTEGVGFGHGARLITDDWDDERRYDRISVWGHQPLRQKAS